MEKKYYVVIQYGYCWYGKGESVDEALKNAAEYMEMSQDEALQAFYGDEDGNFPEIDGNECRILDARPPRVMTEIGATYVAECEAMERNRDRGIHTFSGPSGRFEARADIFKHIWNVCHSGLKNPDDLPRFKGHVVSVSSMCAHVEDVTAEPGTQCPHCTGYGD